MEAEYAYLEAYAMLILLKGQKKNIYDTKIIDITYSKGQIKALNLYCFYTKVIRTFATFRVCIQKRFETDVLTVQIRNIMAQSKVDVLLKIHTIFYRAI